MSKKWYEHDIMIAFVFVLISRLSYLFAAGCWNRARLSSDSIISLLNTWDANWYHSVVVNGYMYEPFLQPRGDGANWAFFPLYPMVVRGVSSLSGIDAETAGVFLSSLFLVVAIVFAMRYLVLTRNGIEPVTIAFLLAFGPYSFYFSALYTEAMFVMLVAMSLYFIEKRQWLACGIAGALLTAVRPTGVFIVLVVLIKLISIYREENLPFSKIIPGILKDHKQLFCLALIPAGLAAYMTFLYFYVGDPLAFQRIQIAWFRVATNPLYVLYSGFTGSAHFVYLATWGLAGLALSFYLIRAKRYGEGLFGLLIMLVPMSSALMSLPRFLVGSLVLLLAFNDFTVLNFKKYYWFIYGLLALFNLFLLIRWFASDPLLI